MSDAPKLPDDFDGTWLDFVVSWPEGSGADIARAELAELRRLAAIGKLVEDSEADVEAGRVTDHEDVKRELG